MHAEEGYLHIGLAIVLFLGRVVGTCALFYGFFLCRMLGAGDIKLMAVCVGCLGIWTGALVIFCGMGLALAAAFLKGNVWKYGWRMIRGMEMRLAPYLFAGYCAVIVLGQSGLMDAV